MEHQNPANGGIFLEIEGIRRLVETMAQLLWILLFSGASRDKSKQTKSSSAGKQPASNFIEQPLGTAAKPVLAPPFYALIIGIDEYPHRTNLRGAVADAEAMETYLRSELNVPKDQIIQLHNSRATRHRIIKKWKSLYKDKRIHRGDPILIYFAGHGASAAAPSNWAEMAGGRSAKIQLLVPYDYDGQKVQPIADVTLGHLLDKLSNAKGNNITVIFDKCHAASGTRADENDPSLLIRSLEIDERKNPLPRNLDEDVWDNAKRIVPRAAIPARHDQALGSHILLAACGADEYAKEQQGRGWFTKALLEVLYRVGAEKLTYSDLMKRLPDLSGQNPHCEGDHRDRLLFDGKAPSQSRTMYLVRVSTVEGKSVYTMDAGAAVGITEGSQYAIYQTPDASKDPKNRIGILVAEGKPAAFETVLTGSLEGQFDEKGWALQTRAGEEEDLRVRIVMSNKLVPVFKKLAEDMQSRSGEKQGILLVDDDTADLDVSLDQENRVVFHVPQGACTQYGHSRLPNTLPPDVDMIYPVIRSAARYYWHLKRSAPASESRGLSSLVRVEFHELMQENDGWDGQLRPILKPVEPLVNFNQANVVDLIVGDGGNKMYGLKVSNISAIPLYVSAFYFDNSDFSILPYYQPPLGINNHIDPSIPANGSLTIGYGAGGGTPFTYHLRPEQNIDVGFLKLFITNVPLDLSDLPQPSPFEDPARASGIAALPKPLLVWDTVLITMVQRRDAPNHE